jgi:hypothetical protein
MVGISLGRTTERHEAGWAVRVPSGCRPGAPAGGGSVVLTVTFPGRAQLYRNICAAADEARRLWHLFWYTVLVLQLSLIVALAVADACVDE